MEPQPQPTPPPMDAPDDLSSVWDLSYLLDFNLDDDALLNLNLQNEPPPPPPIPNPNPNPNPPENDKIRKRDPRLTCSNFLAGHVPCACPELDALLEDNGLPGKKRARAARASASARCQVPSCEVDISELKGYHRRHRVCLRCATAVTVLIDGEVKRYCQQCGKFHVLPDFDEGKRSCRRKLERHNTRRRRKPADSASAVDHEVQTVTQNDDANCDGEAGIDYSNLSSENIEKRVSLDHEEEPVAVGSSTPETQNINGESGVSFVASAETQANVGNDVSNLSKSPSYCDNKNDYSSMCQTGRVSFKLYDWNPAEFPRRLRLQIFQWLASMPVELEGYIRPGCTILTVFVAMPNIMWINLLKDPMYYVRDIVAPKKMLSGRGAALIHLNDMIFRVMKDGSSVTKVEVNMQAPKLHYIHPTCFEAGKPMEFFACGSNLLQPKFRLLVSFYGKYMKYEYCVPSPHNWSEDSISCSFDNQLYKIRVPHIEENLMGPAFIEVENESGLSNFIPVLIGDKEICTEMKILQQKQDTSLLSKQFRSASGGSICSSCKAFVHIHASSSDLLVDIAWLLKDPTSENFDRMVSASQIQRYCHLLDFLINNDSTIILGKILQNLIILTESIKSNTNDVDIVQLLKCMHNARDAICQKGGSIVLHSKREGFKPARCCSQDDKLSVDEDNCQGILFNADPELGVPRSLTFDEKNHNTPLLKRDIIMNMEDLPNRRDHRHITRGFLTSRPTIFVLVSVVVCLAVCVSVYHRGRVTELAVSIRRCLFNH
ncbi:squamosa promoter-binding-like protein 7 [Vicia villosa]|uniref:squamosa promoter-binding-like protein 7 n=1 Tax=Vicia villosa TaxID=3911 RepID=UPI00273AB409|nr:squamosa promoter-binding-like protein 7 [Vicia villosa]